MTDEESWGEMGERTKKKKNGKITVAQIFPPFLPGKWISRSRESLSFLFLSFSFSTMPFSQTMTEKKTICPCLLIRCRRKKKSVCPFVVFLPLFFWKQSSSLKTGLFFSLCFDVSVSPFLSSQLFTRQKRREEHMSLQPFCLLLP